MAPLQIYRWLIIQVWVRTFLSIGFRFKTILRVIPWRMLVCLQIFLDPTGSTDCPWDNEVWNSKRIVRTKAISKRFTSIEHENPRSKCLVMSIDSVNRWKTDRIIFNFVGRSLIVIFISIYIWNDLLKINLHLISVGNNLRHHKWWLLVEYLDEIDNQMMSYLLEIIQIENLSLEKKKKKKMLTLI